MEVVLSGEIFITGFSFCSFMPTRIYIIENNEIVFNKTKKVLEEINKRIVKSTPIDQEQEYLSFMPQRLDHFYEVRKLFTKISLPVDSYAEEFKQPFIRKKELACEFLLKDIGEIDLMLLDYHIAPNKKFTGLHLYKTLGLNVPAVLYTDASFSQARGIERIADQLGLGKLVSIAFKDATEGGDHSLYLQNQIARILGKEF